MNELQIFNNDEFGEIRTVTIDNEPWFVGKDVAVALGYKDAPKAVKAHVDSDDKGVGEIPTPGGEQTMTIINESGVYSLIFGSKLESAKRFKHWVTSEVLPALRKTGTYSMKKNLLSVDEAFRMVEILNQTQYDKLPYVIAIFKSAGINVPEKTESHRNAPRGRMQYTKKYADTTNVTDFLKTVDSVINRPSADVYEEYAEWCEDEPVSKTMFSRLVNQILGTQITIMKIKGHTKRVFVL